MRGSVPLYWRQEGLKAKLFMMKDAETNKIALTEHIKSLNEDYDGQVLVLNLLKETKDREKKLSDTFKKYCDDFRKIVPNQYHHFDFYQ